MKGGEELLLFTAFLTTMSDEKISRQVVSCSTYIDLSWPGGGGDSLEASLSPPDCRLSPQERASSPLPKLLKHADLLFPAFQWLSDGMRSQPEETTKSQLPPVSSLPLEHVAIIIPIAMRPLFAGSFQVV